MCKKWMKEITFSAQLFALNQQEPPHLSTTAEPSAWHSVADSTRLAAPAKGMYQSPNSLGYCPSALQSMQGCWFAPHPRGGVLRMTYKGPKEGKGAPRAAHGVHCPGFALWASGRLHAAQQWSPAFSGELPLEAPSFCWLQRSVLYLLCLAPCPDQRVFCSLTGSRS